MAFEAHCPNPLCGKVYRVSEELAGRQAKCHWCGESFRIPYPQKSEPERRIGSRETSARPTSLLAKRAGLAIAAAGFGLVGLLSSIFLVGIVPGGIAVVLGIFARKKAKEKPEQFAGIGIARAGIAFGAAAVVIGIAAIPVWIGIARGIRSRLQLERISFAIENYKKDSGGEYPTRLEELEKYGSAGAILSGSRKERHLEDFVYLKPEADSPDDIIVLYAKKGYFPLGRPALHKNGKSTFLSEKELKKALEETPATKSVESQEPRVRSFENLFLGTLDS